MEGQINKFFSSCASTAIGCFLFDNFPFSLESANIEGLLSSTSSILICLLCLIKRCENIKMNIIDQRKEKTSEMNKLCNQTEK